MVNSSSKLLLETVRTLDLPYNEVPSMLNTTNNLEQNSGCGVKTYFSSIQRNALQHTVFSGHK